MKDNKHIKETQVVQVASDTEQRCFERANKASNARQAAQIWSQMRSDVQQYNTYAMPDMWNALCVACGVEQDQAQSNKSLLTLGGKGQILS